MVDIAAKKAEGKGKGCEKWATLHEKKDLQKQLLAYIRTKPARDGLRVQKTEKARRAYREQHNEIHKQRA